MGLHAWYDAPQRPLVKVQTWIVCFVDPETGRDDRYFAHSQAEAERQAKQLEADGFLSIRIERAKE